MPHDDQFYDGYDVFIQNLQADLEDDAHDIYNDDHQQQQQQQQQPYQGRGRSERGWTGQGRRRHNTRKSGYRRDPTDDMTMNASETLDEVEISRLIALRSKAQKERNYAHADDIRDELNNVHGVFVWDKDGLWSVSPIAPSRRYRNYAVGNNHNNNNNNGYGNNNGNLDGNNHGGDGPYQNHHGKKQFGRNGHDYTQIGNDIDQDFCSLKLHEIHGLIAKRLGFKLMRDFKKADEIQTVLYKNGIQIHDKLKQWRADGGIFDEVDGMVSGKPFSMNPHSDAFDDNEVLEEILEVVSVRDEARSRADYAEADRLRSVLWENFRVAVDDKSRTFSLGGDFGINGTFRWTDDGPISARKGRNDSSNSRDWRVMGGMYTKSSESLDLAEKDLDEVNNLIHDRLEAKRVRDYEVADLIRSHLYSEYNISVDDQLRQWSVGGAFDGEATRSLRSTSPTTSSKSSYVRKYNRRGGTGHLTEKEIMMVDSMVARRAEEMSRFNKEAAESVRKGLKNNYYVIIDDMNDEWHVRGNDFILSPDWEQSDLTLPQCVVDSRQEIEKLIRERSQARREKDFARADEIRSDLMDTYKIKLDDRIKEWSIIVDDGDDDHLEKVEVEVKMDENKQTLSKLTIVQLKEKLRQKGLPVSGGRKADLIERIILATRGGS